MRLRTIPSLGVLAASAGLAACAQPVDCNMGGCESRARVHLARSIAQPYDVAVVLSAERLQPERRVNDEGSQTNEIVLAPVTRAREEASLRCASGRLMPTSVPAEDDAPLSCDDTGFDLPDTVVRVDVTVTSATASAEGSGDVRYAPVFVNGAQCGVTCFDGVLLVGGGAGE